MSLINWAVQLKSISPLNPVASHVFRNKSGLLVDVSGFVWRFYNGMDPGFPIGKGVQRLKDPFFPQKIPKDYVFGPWRCFFKEIRLKRKKFRSLRVFNGAGKTVRNPLEFRQRPLDTGSLQNLLLLQNTTVDFNFVCTGIYEGNIVFHNIGIDASFVFSCVFAFSFFVCIIWY